MTVTIHEVGVGFCAGSLFALALFIGAAALALRWAAKHKTNGG